MLRVEGLSKGFGGVQALTELSFQVEEGEIFSVIGPNGAGKTTLFNVITGIYPADSGEISFLGRSIRGLPPYRVARLGISRTFQNLQIFLNMTTLENVMVGCHLRTRSGFLAAGLRTPAVRREERQAREWAMEALARCGMDHLAPRLASSLPYGMMKRLEIARALASRPRLLLLDEPAAGLNESETGEMAGLIQEICDSGVTVLLVEHNMELIMGISHRVLVLNYGRLLAMGPPKEVQNDPQVIAAYLG